MALGRALGNPGICLYFKSSVFQAKNCPLVLCLARMSRGVDLPSELVDSNSFRHSMEISAVENPDLLV